MEGKPGLLKYIHLIICNSYATSPVGAAGILPRQNIPNRGKNRLAAAPAPACQRPGRSIRLTGLMGRVNNC